jgi:hypothetical protein
MFSLALLNLLPEKSTPFAEGSIGGDSGRPTREEAAPVRLDGLGQQHQTTHATLGQAPPRRDWHTGHNLLGRTH